MSTQTLASASGAATEGSSTQPPAQPVQTASSSSSHTTSIGTVSTNNPNTNPGVGTGFGTSAFGAQSSSLLTKEISSPHQLVDWVDTLLGQLESRFDDMNSQVTLRMNEMSSRIDALENSIQDLIHGTAASSTTSQPLKDSL